MEEATSGPSLEGRRGGEGDGVGTSRKLWFRAKGVNSEPQDTGSSPTRGPAAKRPDALRPGWLPRGKADSPHTAPPRSAQEADAVAGPGTRRSRAAMFSGCGSGSVLGRGGRRS